jgi:hypothetical protein
VSDRIRKLKRSLKLVVFALTPAAVLLVAAEVFATFTIQRVVRTVPDSVTGQTLYTMRIGRFPWSQRSVTPLNKLGLPDVEFEELPTKDRCVHVVFVGDSFVFGDGVDADSNFVSVVRRWGTDRRPNDCVRVFNLGERGTTIDNQAQRIRDTQGALQPDVVILGQYQNDLTDLLRSPVSPDRQPPAAAGDSSAWRDVRQQMIGAFNLNIVRLLSYRAFGIAIRNGIHYDILPRWSIVADTTRREAARELMTSYEKHFAALRAHLAEGNVGFGVVILPSKFDLLAGRFPEEAFFIELADRFGVPYLRTFSVLDQHRSPYPFLMYDGHLNEIGNRRVAESVYQWLYESEPAPFPVLRPD